MTLIEYRSGLISLLSLDARRVSPDRTQTTVGAISHRRPIPPTQHRRAANQAADPLTTRSRDCAGILDTPARLGAGYWHIGARGWPEYQAQLAPSSERITVGPLRLPIARGSSLVRQLVQVASSSPLHVKGNSGSSVERLPTARHPARILVCEVAIWRAVVAGRLDRAAAQRARRCGSASGSAARAGSCGR